MHIYLQKGNLTEPVRFSKLISIMVAQKMKKKRPKHKDIDDCLYH